MSMDKNLGNKEKERLKSVGKSFSERPSFMDRVKSSFGMKDKPEKKKPKKKKPYRYKKPPKKREVVDKEKSKKFSLFGK